MSMFKYKKAVTVYVFNSFEFKTNDCFHNIFLENFKNQYYIKLKFVLII